MHQRASTDAGASPGSSTSPSTTIFSDSTVEVEGAGTAISGVSGVVGGVSHHGGTKFPLESVASDGGV